MEKSTTERLNKMLFQRKKKAYKGEQSGEFYETLFELEGVRNEEKGAFLEQNISLALLYNIKAISETS